MDANVRGIWFMAKAVGSYWIKNQVRGKVLLMSSVRGRHGNYSGYTGYCASKGATDGLTRVLATEWARHGISGHAVWPLSARPGYRYRTSRPWASSERTVRPARFPASPAAPHRPPGHGGILTSR